MTYERKSVLQGERKLGYATHHPWHSACGSGNCQRKYDPQFHPIIRGGAPGNGSVLIGHLPG